MSADQSLVTVATAISVTSLLLIAAVLVAHAMQRKSAAVRHLMWLLALVSSAEVIVMTPYVPRVAITIAVPASLSTIQPATPEATHTPPPNIAVSHSNAQRPREFAPVVSGTSISAQSGRTLGIYVWLAGMLLLLAHRLMGEIRVVRLTRRAVAITNAEWLQLLHRLSNDAVLNKRPLLLRSTEVTSPSVSGIRQPVILLPTWCDEWNEVQKRAVLLHEIAHITRHDTVSGLVATCALAVQWFNPLAWFAVRRLHAEAEQSCDDFALSAGVRRLQYAETLIAVARVAISPRLTNFPFDEATLQMARQHQIESRIAAILNPLVPRTRPRSVATLVAVALTVVTAIPLTAFRPAFKPVKRAAANTTKPQVNVTSTTDHKQSLEANDSDTLSARLATPGTLAIRGWSESRVALQAMLGGDATPQSVGLNRAGRVLSLSLNTPDHSPLSSQKYGLEVNVPQGMNVDVESAHGSVRIDDVPSGAKRVHVQRGDIFVGTPIGSGEFTTLKGNVEIHGAAGDIVTGTSNGSVTLYAIAGSVSAKAARGDVHVTLAGQSDATRLVLLTAVTGNVILDVPDNLSATVAIESVAARGAGTVESDWPLAMRAAVRHDSAHQRDENVKAAQGVIGSGNGPHIVIRVDEGSVNIRRIRR